MNVTKFDAALSLQLVRQHEGNVEVSVRLHAQLTPDEAKKLQKMGFPDANTKRKVLFGRLSTAKLPLVARLDKVAQLSLTQKMTPSAMDAHIVV